MGSFGAKLAALESATTKKQFLKQMLPLLRCSSRFSPNLVTSKCIIRAKPFRNVTCDLSEFVRQRRSIATVIDGKRIGDALQSEIRSRVTQLKQNYNVTPQIGVILVGSYIPYHRAH